MKKLIFLILFLSIAVQSCYKDYSSKVYYLEKTATFQKKYDEVWEKLIKFFNEKQMPITFVDKNSGIINVAFSPNDDLANKYADYKVQGKSSELSECNSNIYIVLKAQNNEVTLKIDAKFNAKVVKKEVKDKFEILKEDKVDCISTGGLEFEIFDYINKWSLF